MKNLKRIGKIALCKCPLSHKTYGVRFEKVGKAWKYDWAFRISLQAASREHYDETKLVGKVVMDNKYPGCPYCKAIGFVICDCGCKQEGILGGGYTGSGFASGGDL